MKKTIVLQSHKTPLPALWLERCLASVKKWSEDNNYDYLFIGDELFKDIPQSLLEKTKQQKVIATDLGRLKTLQQLLASGYETVVWCDADFLIFNSKSFRLPSVDELPEGYALGREVWIQEDGKNSGKLKSYTKVHNAFMLFRQGNYFLDFYADNAERLLNKVTGSVPPQFIGPKLLTALHNVIQCPVVESAGMLSPVVLFELLTGEGEAVGRLKQKSVSPLHAANLCSSLIGKDKVSNEDMGKIISLLIERAEL